MLTNGLNLVCSVTAAGPLACRHSCYIVDGAMAAAAPLCHLSALVLHCQWTEHADAHLLTFTRLLACRTLGLVVAARHRQREQVQQAWFTSAASSNLRRRWSDCQVEFCTLVLWERASCRCWRCLHGARLYTPPAGRQGTAVGMSDFSEVFWFVSTRLWALQGVQ